MKRQKKMTAKQKKILDISVICLQVAVVVIAIVISAIVIANPLAQSAKVSSSKTKLLPVLTDSMVGNLEDSFNAGDLVVGKTPKDKLALEKGDIITYVGPVDGYDALITHRIVDVVLDGEGKAVTYFTLGDAQPRDADRTAVNPYDVLAVYKYHLKGVGKAINWLQDDTHFLLVIVLPLIALFVYNIIGFVKMIMQGKLDKAKEATAGVDEEEIKRRAIEEYLASQKDNATKEDKTE
jgi:signal peptidase